MNFTKLIAGILVVLALALGLLAWQIGSRPEPASVASTDPSLSVQVPATEQNPAEALHDMVILTQSVPAGHKLTMADLKVIQVATPVPGSFDNLEDVLGKVTVQPMYADSPIFEPNLLQGLSLQLEQGERAVSIAVNETMAAGHRVRPGDFVDVFFTLNGQDEQTPVDTQTRLLMARTRVLAYGGASVETPPPTEAQLREEQAQNASGSGRNNNAADTNHLRPENARTAVLAVPLEEVHRLTLAEKYGQLTLALRHPDDLGIPDESLFANLPPALRPASGRLAPGQQLESIDRAYAGLRFNDLARGADPQNRKSTPPPSALNPSLLAQQAPVAASPAAAAEATQPKRPRQHEVELYTGSTVQTVRY
ncbi:pilus assembly protein CpaB [Lampropedia hyalina DSM 16112]|jgi:pilus assembly protein CpaB|uniref:Pilus assembly protein CpaB n=1 Tax=Lampropedia hyalina DSM 16112 TaxID=1122156 RepID=A0A1M4VBG6_9BURK|nr:Flp pilus assembly protein CpaB [Lampropedia hyalina]SHE66168.1 pilus assembly protein CpaB [Lampropedia hyalina DSM 16112]